MIDFAEDLRQTLVSLARENKALSDNLTAVQTRCTELLEEKRLLYKMCETLRHERNLAAESVANGFWLWSDTDDNWLDGLANDALITMRAGQLRGLIAQSVCDALRWRPLTDDPATWPPIDERALFRMVTGFVVIGEHVDMPTGAVILDGDDDATHHLGDSLVAWLPIPADE